MISLNLRATIKFYAAIVFEGRFSSMRSFSRTRRLAGSDKNERGNSSVVEKRAANEQGEFPGTGTRFSSRSKKTGRSNVGERKRERERRSAWYSRREFRRYSRRGRDWIYPWKVTGHGPRKENTPSGIYILRDSTLPIARATTGIVLL